MLIQSGPEDDEGDALLAIATQAGTPKHMNLGLVQMKDQERLDRYTAWNTFPGDLRCHLLRRFYTALKGLYQSLPHFLTGYVD